MAESHRFHHYEVQRDAAGELVELGRGNMGVTYKGFDTSLRCPVALKTLLPTLCSSQKMRERFIREAQATAQVQVDNVLRVTYLAAAPSEPRPFYVMELIAGQTLGSVVKAQGCLAPKDAVAVGLQVTEALIAIHRCGLVHRDIKPENLMRVPLEKGFVVKVIDFGVARWSDGASHSELTFGGFVGTPAFASPEQVRGEPVDIRSDIYSLGATLFYLLTGRLLFDTRSSRPDFGDHSPESLEQLAERQKNGRIIPASLRDRVTLRPTLHWR